MKTLKLSVFFICSLLLTVATQYEEDILALTYEEERADLDRYKNTIEEFAAKSAFRF